MKKEITKKEIETRWTKLVEEELYAEAERQDFFAQVTPLKDYETCKKSWMREQKANYSFEENIGAFLRAIQLITDELDQVVKEQDKLQSIKEQLHSSFKKLKENTPSEDKNSAIKWYQVMGLEEISLEAIYSLANKMFKEQRIDDYGNLLLFLTSIDPYRTNFRLGYAAFFILQKRYQEALNFLKETIEMDCRCKEAYQYAICCYLALGEEEQALSCLKRNIDLFDEKEVNSTAKELICALSN